MKKRALKFDLESSVESRLPAAVQDMLADVANVSYYVNEYKQLGVDHEAVPFGRIKKSVVEEAREILRQLKPLVKDKANLEQKRYRYNTEALTERLFDAVEEISRLSSEYYHLMPKRGMEYVRLQPIDNEGLLQQEVQRAEAVLELEVAERLLLAAMYRRAEVNPVDYIYHAMGVRVEALKPEEGEAQVVMRYLYNSEGASDTRIEGIFKLARPQEDKGHCKALPAARNANRRLLWHGSKASNLMSIFMKGLLIDAPFAPVTGRSWGNGLYTADVFEKSFNYTFDGRHSRWSGSKYMLLCDVGLGSVRRLFSYESDAHLLPGKGYQSTEAVGRLVPDPVHTITCSNGVKVPLGKVVENKEKDPKDKRKKHGGGGGLFGGGLFGWHHNSYPVEHAEFITYSESQSALRYLVQLRNDYSASAGDERMARKRMAKKRALAGAMVHKSAFKRPKKARASLFGSSRF